MHVAFTRCKNPLIIFGSEIDNSADMFSWYDFANFAMRQDYKNYIINMLETLKLVSNVKYKITKEMM